MDQLQIAQKSENVLGGGGGGSGVLVEIDSGASRAATLDLPGIPISVPAFGLGIAPQASIPVEVKDRAWTDDPVWPKHYRGDLVMRIIETFELGFELGNVIKYILRHAAKAGLEDLRKAAWYLQRRIEQLEGKHTEGVK